MKTYTTKKGDMWDKIAREQLGNEMYANQLIDANFKYSSLVIFEAGIILDIPEINSGSSTVSLPPWKQ